TAEIAKLPGRCTADAKVIGVLSHLWRAGKSTEGAEASEASAAAAAELVRGHEGPVVRRRPQRREQLRLNHRTWDVERRIEVHLKRQRSAGNEGEAHVVPILIAGVLHHRPTLQQRLAPFIEDEAIARLPDRVLDDVTDAHAPLAV